MSEPQQEYTPPATQSLPSQPNPPQPRRSCLSQILGLVGWIFTLLLSVALSLAAIAAIAYFGFGFTLQTPGQVSGTPAEFAALRAANDEANARIGDLQTEVAQQGSAGSNNSEQLDDVDNRISTMQTEVALAAQQASELQNLGRDMEALGQELEDNIALAATLQAEARDDQVAIAVFATVQADNTVRLNELQQRADRLTRFIDRLGDIVGDTQQDIATPTPGATLTDTPTATPGPFPSPTPSATPAASPSTTSTATP